MGDPFTLIGFIIPRMHNNDHNNRPILVEKSILCHDVLLVGETDVDGKEQVKSTHNVKCFVPGPYVCSFLQNQIGRLLYKNSIELVS